MLQIVGGDSIGRNAPHGGQHLFGGVHIHGKEHIPLLHLLPRCYRYILHHTGDVRVHLPAFRRFDFPGTRHGFFHSPFLECIGFDLNRLGFH